MKQAGSVFMGATLLEPGQGGIAVVARMTARALASLGVPIELLSLSDKTPIDIDGIPSATAGNSKLAYLLRCHLAALRHDRFIYDHVGVARAHPRISPLKRPYAVWMHGVEVWYHLTPAKKRILQDADLVLVNSQFTLDKYQSLHGPLENARVCQLATEQDEPPDVMPDFTGPPTVLILGRQDKDDYYKGHRELIACWPEVVKAVPEARLIIAGGGDGLPLTRRLVAESPVADHIEVLGFVPNEELPALWKKAHVFAMPSRGEGFGLVYVEAMRHGLPVIASVHDAGQEVNRSGKTGYNVDLDLKGDLAGRLIELLRRRDLCRRLGRNARTLWHSQFRSSAFNERIRAAIGSWLSV